MRRWAEFVLAHRRWVVLFWLAVVVAGAALGWTSSRVVRDSRRQCTYHAGNVHTMPSLRPADPTLSPTLKHARSLPSAIR